MIHVAGAAAAALMAAAAALYAVAFVRGRAGLYAAGLGAGLGALLLLLFEGVWHLAVEKRLPFLDFASTAMALSFLAAAAALWAHVGWKAPSVGAVLFPLSAVVQVSARLFVPDLRIVAGTEVLGERGLTAFLLVHVGLVFLGYAALFVSASASAMYLILDRDLKRGHPGPFYRGVPPLASSAFVSVRSLGAGVLLLGAGLGLGVVRSIILPPTGTSILADYRVLAASAALLYFIAILLLGRRLAPGLLSRLVIVGAAGLLLLHTAFAVAPGIHRFGL